MSPYACLAKKSGGRHTAGKRPSEDAFARFEPSWLPPDSVLDKSILAFVRAVESQTQRQESYRLLVQGLCRRAAQVLWPRSAVELYGSFASGLAPVWVRLGRGGSSRGCSCKRPEFHGISGPWGRRRVKCCPVIFSSGTPRCEFRRMKIRAPRSNSPPNSSNVCQFRTSSTNSLRFPAISGEFDQCWAISAKFRRFRPICEACSVDLGAMSGDFDRHRPKFGTSSVDFGRSRPLGARS